MDNGIDQCVNGLLFQLQPSRSKESDKDFFGCKAYLTVSGQLQAEALARCVVGLRFLGNFYYIATLLGD